MTTARTVFYRWWVGLWAANVAVLTGLLAYGVSPKAWSAAFLVLFLLPEMIGLRTRGDRMPPLTYVTRRYIARWVPSAITFGVGAWMAYAWLAGAHRAKHPLIVAVAIAGMVGWLTNHWDVTYDGEGE